MVATNGAKWTDSTQNGLDGLLRLFLYIPHLGVRTQPNLGGVGLRVGPDFFGGETGETGFFFETENLEHPGFPTEKRGATFFVCLFVCLFVFQNYGCWLTL